MKKYLLSTLTAAAAMAVPAFSAELIGSWDFSNSISDGKIYATGGNTELYVSAGGNDSLSNGILTIVPATDNKATVNISSEDISLDEGISVVLTITGWSSSSSGTAFASIETDGSGSDSTYAAAIGESGSGSNSRSPWFAADGHASNVDSTTYGNISVDWNVGVTVAMTFIGDTLSLYQLVNGSYTLLAVGTISASAYSDIVGNIEEVAIGSWDGTSTDSEFTNLSISSLEIYRGDIMAVPEPSMFGLMFGLGAIGLVATRRRRR